MDENVRQVGGPRAAPRDVGEARATVEASRQRVAATLEELEGRLVEEKEAIQEKLDVARPVREYASAKPLVAVGIAAGAGLLLGLLTGGGSRRDEEDGELTERESRLVERWRSERRKRLLSTAEDELPSFEPPPSRIGRLFRDMTHELVGAATALLVAGLVDRVKDEEEEEEEQEEGEE